MAAKDQSLTIRIKGDSTDLQKDIGDIQKIVERAGASIVRQQQNIDKFGKVISQTVKIAAKDVNALAREFENLAAVSTVKTSTSKEQDSAAALKQKLALHKEVNSEIISRMRDTISIRTLIATKGENSLVAITAQANAKRKQLARDLNTHLREIESGARSTEGRAAAIQKVIDGNAAADRQIETAAKAHARRMDGIREFSNDKALSVVKGRIARTIAAEKFGIHSIEVARIDSANKRIEIEKNLQSNLRNIQSKLARGAIGLKGAEARRAAVLRHYEKEELAVKRVTAANEDYGRSILGLTGRHKILMARIFEVVVGYRAINAAINTTLQAIKSIPRIGIELETTVATLNATLGSDGRVVGAMAALNNEAERTGINLTVLRENFRNLNASMKLSGETTETSWKIFTNLNTAITGLHLPAEKAKGVFSALTQIFSKTKVQSEELVKQLGNLLPGAFNSFRKANEETFKTNLDLIKAMSAGTVFAHETVAKFAEFYAGEFQRAFNSASDGLNANIGRMQNNWKLLGEEIYAVGKGPMKSMVKGLASLGDYLKRTIEGTTTLSTVFDTLSGVAIGAVVSGLVSAGLYLQAYIANVLVAAGATNALTSSMIVLRGAMAFLSAPTVIVAGIATLAYEISQLGQHADNAKEQLDEMILSLNTLETTPKEINPIKAMVDSLPIVKESLKSLQILQIKALDLNKRLTELKDDGLDERNGIFASIAAERDKHFDYIIGAKKKLDELRGIKHAEIAAQIKLEKDAAEQARKDAKAMLDAMNKNNVVGITQVQIATDYNTALSRVNQNYARLTGNVEAYNNARLDRNAQKDIDALLAAGDVEGALKADDVRTLQTQMSKINQALIDRRYLLQEVGKQRGINAIMEQTAQRSELDGMLAVDKIRDQHIEKLKVLISTTETSMRALNEGDLTKPMEEKLKRLKDQLELLEVAGSRLGNSIRVNLTDNLGTAFSDFIMGSKDAGEAMKGFATSVLNSVANIAANQLATMLIGGITQGFGALTSNSPKADLIKNFDFSKKFDTSSLRTSAKGNVFESGVTQHKRGGIPDVGDKLAYFPMANGGVGSLRENGKPEAILPLKRNSSGDLGVVSSASGGGSSGGISIGSMNISVVEKEGSTAQEQSKSIAKAVEEQMKALIQDQMRSAARPGNMYNRTQVASVF